MQARRRRPLGGPEWVLIGLAGITTFSVMGCSTSSYRADADSEVYRIIEEKQEEGLGQAHIFSIDRPEETARDRIRALLERNRFETLGQKLIREIDEDASPSERAEASDSESVGGEAEQDRLDEKGPWSGRTASQQAETSNREDSDSANPPQDSEETAEEAALLTLSLRDCLEIAAENSRPFQDQRERVYLTVLNLTQQRWNFGIQHLGFLSSRWIYSGKDAKGNDIQQVSVDPNYTLSKRFEQGASIALNLGASLVRTITGGGSDTDVSLLGLSMTQPLMRGSGAVASEPLTQAERDAIYAVRTFERFKKTLAVQISSDFYRVLQSLDQVDNERRNLEQLNLSLARSEALARAGRLPEFEVDQTRQQVLSARDRLIQARVTFQSSLDQFKVTLGLSPDAPVDLDRGELAGLPDPTDEALAVTKESAVRIALRTRLDLQNTRDFVVDAERKVDVAADGLRTELNLVASADVSSRRSKLGELRFDEASYRAGFDLDLPLNRLPERNSYRSALISLRAAARDATLQEDQISLDIRDSIRTLERSRESITIRKNAVDLASRRVESTKLLLEAGRVTSRDLLESQQALVDSENSLIRARVDYYVNQISLLRDLEILSIEPGGLNIQNDLDELESLTDVNPE